MGKSATALASKLLKGEPGQLEPLKVHEFADDEAAHDSESIESLWVEFSAACDGAAAELSKKYGAPTRTGDEDDDVIPLNGVLRFALWSVGDRQLFVAAAHEDREVPILLMLGTTADGVA